MEVIFLNLYLTLAEHFGNRDSVIAVLSWICRMCNKKSRIQVAGLCESGQAVPLSAIDALSMMIIFVEEKRKLL